jgi:DNA-binding MarR family transcriptional regulator
MNRQDREESVTLEILEAIDDREGVTQRHLSKRLGVALGLTNSYVKRCAQKGWIKVHQAPANRYLYYLTPKGFAEKSRLTAKYLSLSLNFYRKAGASCGRAFEWCLEQGWRGVLLCGVSDLAEIAAIKAMAYEMDVLGAYDPGSAQQAFLSRPIYRHLEEAGAPEAFLVTAIDSPWAWAESHLKGVEPGRVVVPDIMGQQVLTEKGGQPV